MRARSTPKAFAQVVTVLECTPSINTGAQVQTTSDMLEQE